MTKIQINSEKTIFDFGAERGWSKEECNFVMAATDGAFCYVMERSERPLAQKMAEELWQGNEDAFLTHKLFWYFLRYRRNNPQASAGVFAAIEVADNHQTKEWGSLGQKLSSDFEKDIFEEMAE